jgi:phenylacetate-CoA ligase
MAFLDRVMLRLPTPWAVSMINALPSSWQDRKRKNDLKTSLRLAATRSKFYREKFRSVNADLDQIQSPGDLGRFFTTADDLLNVPSEDFLCASPQLAFETAGTSGRNKRLFYDYEEFEKAARRASIGFYLCGVRPEDRILNAYDFSFWFPGYFIARVLPYTGAFSITVGKIEPVEVYRRMEGYRFTVMLGEPTWMVQLTELAEAKGRAYPLKLIVGSGEMLTERARAWIEKTWQATFLMAYASVDAGTAIGLECQEKQGYHINDTELWIEIVDADEEGYGEVVFTTLGRTTMPLIRYRTKDIARLIHAPCTCGRPGRRLSKIIGRADEMVVFGGGNIHPSFFEDIFKEIPEITEDWQVAVRHREVKEILEFRVELKEDSQPTEPVARKVKSAIEARYPDMWRNYVKGMFDIDFAYATRNTLRQTRKLRRLVDERDEIRSDRSAL